MRAITRNIASGEYTAGGSTITQQLAKNMFFSFDKVLERKFAEVFMASKIESTYTKEEILELYVNIIDFGSGYVGVGEAARGYYGKEHSASSFASCGKIQISHTPSSLYSNNRQRWKNDHQGADGKNTWSKIQDSCNRGKLQ
jgi:membrane peptidoglycan carboxypeptidase